MAPVTRFSSLTPFSPPPTPGVGISVKKIRPWLAELASVGVVADAIGPCTAESAELFSYRRDGVTGRFAGAIWLDR